MGPRSSKATAQRPPDDPDRARLLALLETSTDILSLASGLLRICRDRLDALIPADNDLSTWARRDRLRRAAQDQFEAIDDEEIAADERTALRALAGDQSELPVVAVARAFAEALDAALGHRLLPMFLNRSVTLKEGDPIPTPHPDWRTLTPSPNSDPWSLDGRLDALPHLRLAADWTRHVRVTLDGDWRTWNAIPQLAAGDRVACALPNEQFDELSFERYQEQGVALFSQLAPIIGDDEQAARCETLLERARERGVRVVVFPELSVPKPVLERIARWLNRQQVVELVVAGSRHRKAKGGRWHNEAQILFRGWTRRRRHRKFRPFSFIDRAGDEPVRRHEDLAVAQPSMRAFLSPGWTLATLICKDFVVEPTPRMLGDLRANLVLVPALSFKLDAFRAAAGDVATWAQGVALVANAGFGASRRAARPGLVIGLPSQAGSVHHPVPPGRSLFVVTIGNESKKPAFTTVHEES